MSSRPPRRTTGLLRSRADRNDDARRSSGVSVRIRITAVVALLVTLALTSAGAIIYALESARLEGAAQRQADQEIAEFRTLQEAGPGSSGKQSGQQGFASVRDLLRVFLERNVPGDDELFVAWASGGPVLISTSRHPGFAETPELARSVGKLLADGGQEQLQSEFGELLVTVQPVKGKNSEGALVVVTFLEDSRDELNQLIRTYVIVSLLSLGLITALAAWQAGRLLAPLRKMSETAHEISGSDLTRRLPETGNDDITALTRTINDMLARLEASFTHQREFLDAAGHELKTPLTILQGHLELLDPDDPVEVAETRALLLDEIDRMSRLVGDLILLSKSARPDFVTPRPTDVPMLVGTVLAKARALGVRDWVDESGATRLAELDEQRITQVLLQLADNAVKHTRPGDTVAIGSSDDGDRVRIWVRDTGHGVAPEHRDVIFDRFTRGTVLPGDEGFGLGLSIVRAVVEAHHGTVQVEDADPPGACFVITLPASSRPHPQEEPVWPAS